MLQSCNGLLICGSLVDDSFAGRFSIFTRYYICKPTTKKFKMLSFPVTPLKDFQFAVNLAFDPLNSPHYKIICIRESSQFENADFYNGRIHWYGYGNESLYFDVENECLKTMPMPIPIPTMDVGEDGRYFGECQGNLYLAVTYYMPVCLEFDVFGLASDYSGWYLKKHLCIGDAEKIFHELNLGCVEYCPGFSGVCFIQSEKEEEPKVVVGADGKIICFDFNEGAWYDPSSGEWKMLNDSGPGAKIGSHDISDYEHLHYETFQTYQYFENLSSICGLTSANTNLLHSYLVREKLFAV
ncbi:hypothetical protein REPUB_Repub06bG0073800 [Reevesia pubescens]